MGFTSSLFRSAILALMVVLLSTATFAAVGIVVNFGPPAIPVYVQPPPPAEGYIWVPGYWAWDPDFGDYYWVPGTWVLAPQVGYLWTPGYWAWNGAGFVFYEGYWGPVVGFYGGINYGFGYFGTGYVGGRWDHDRFYYNRSVTNVNVTNIHNVYNTTVINNTTVNRVSYNAGPGGVNARPTAEQEAAARENRLPPVAAQMQHNQEARNNQQLRASVNQGKPPIAATDRPTNFRGSGVVAAQEAGAAYHPPANREANVPTHASEVQPHQQFPPPNTGNVKLDQQYQKEQQQLYQQHEKEHQQLAQQQQKDHQQAMQQHADQERMQQMEQQHQMQTQQMEARHSQQMQQMQQRQAQSMAHSAPRPPSKP
jgi:hypothetical protein